MNDIQNYLGSIMFESHGQYFVELQNNGYDITKYYNGGYGWGNVSKILALVSYVRGVRGYSEYMRFYESVKQDNDGGLVTPRVYARLTGVKASTQTKRTREYRHRQADEIDMLRESTALAWIDSHLQQARDYIATKQ